VDGVSERAGARLAIGEIARRSGLSVSAVRFYGDRGLLPPADVDPASGYRSYDESQVDDAALIRDLRRLGIGLVAVGAYVTAAPAERRALVDDHVRELERRLWDARAVARALHDDTTRERPMPTTTTVTVSADDLRGAVDQVLPATGGAGDQPALGCVLLEAKDGSLRLVATDRYRLAVRDLAAEGPPEGGLRALLPADTLRALRADLPSDGRVAVAVEGDRVVLRATGFDRSGTQGTGDFPDYEAALVADRAAHQIVVDRDALHDALRHVARQGDTVLVTATPGELALVRRAERLAIAARYDGPEVHVALDPAFAADAVAAALGPDIVLEVGEALQPVVFRSADDGTFTTLLMPVRLD
jgi:DNA-binding transcriptional MerR regulator